VTVLKWLVVLAIVGYLGGLAVLYFKQRDFIFPIPQTFRTAAAAAGFPEAEEHILTTADGEKVIVWHVPAKPDHPVVLYFPGNGDFLAGLVDRLRAIASGGIGIVAVSYRGYAGSSGQPSEQGLLLDAAAAYAFTSARYSADRIVVWGFSLGTGPAVATAGAQPIAKLILEAPYTSMVDVVGSHFPIVPVGWLLRDRFHSDERIARVMTPLLIMHGERDLTIPIRFGERLFGLAPGPKRMVRFPEGGHNDLGNYGAISTARQFIGAPKG
jgi:fermentation-respiration switch protein FrsA (DUF1100 family)